MLYSRSELPNSFVECNVALQRYLHMFANERKKIAKLKWHEKDFLFQNMRSLIDMIAAEWMYHPYHFEMYQS